MRHPDRKHPPLDGEVLLPFDDQSSDRRSFLRAMGYGIVATALAGCSRAPERKIIPWLDAESSIRPGQSYRIATTCGACPAGCGVLATCKDGRPVKLEGIPGHPVGQGALCATGQAAVLELYDSHRFPGPSEGGLPRSIEQADEALMAALGRARADGRAVRLLTGTQHGPSTAAAIEKFLGAFPDARHVVYDPLSASAILDAHAVTHGARILPSYRFGEASVVAAFDADFLATWISPVQFAADYAQARRKGAERGRHPRHWQFEARMSLTGGRADERYRLAPSEVAGALDFLLDVLEGRRTDGGGAPRGEELLRLAEDLRKAGSGALAVCGQNSLAAQVRVNEINRILGAYGSTIDVSRPSLQRLGSDGDLERLAAELQAGMVDVLIVHGVNPAYDHPELLGPALGKAGVVAVLAPVPDETTGLASWILPVPHFLECWDDAEPVAGCIGLAQPAIAPLTRSRTLRECLARWCGDERPDRELVRSALESRVFPGSREGGSFRRWHRTALHDGWVEISGERNGPQAKRPASLPPVAAAAPESGDFELVLYPKVGILDGRHAHNPWLQELPDPVTRLAWECEATLSPLAARRLGVEEGDVVRLSAGQGRPAVLAPVHILPGQHDRVVAMPVGYGRAGTERFAAIGPRWWEGRPTIEPGGRLGVSVQGLAGLADGVHRLDAGTVRVEKTGRRIELATVQGYRSLEVPKHLAPPGGEVRDAVLATTAAKLAADPAGAIRRHHVPARNLWSEDHQTEGPSYGLVVDLAACTGCSACVIACQAENNVPVAGRDEIRRQRDMAWIRIDRYESGEGDGARAAMQPMMCQHCDNAPCESVCPVLATVQSEDGMNQQVYSRCVGTRYCANTCPYKVRRFNWFDYFQGEELEHHALNPDVTVRSRGVMEKCSLCIQRVRQAGIEARRRGSPVEDGEIQTACQQTCPAKAIVFGDRNDKRSELARKAADVRAYRVLDELNVRPAVHYMADVRNPAE